MSEGNCLTAAIDSLGEQFAKRDWKYLDVPAGSPKEKTYEWPGEPWEEIKICVHKGPVIQEIFHRQDFFFFNLAYKGDYGALSYSHDNHITVHEGECYIGQPFAGYALYTQGEEEIIIIGVLVQKQTFFKTFLPVLSADPKLFHFFLEPQSNEFSDDFIHLRFDDGYSVRKLLEMMVVEYASNQEDTQAILRSMALTLFMWVARQYKRSSIAPKNETISNKVVRYIGEHTDSVTLKELAQHFSYHPNYISTLLKREIGKSFSDILLELRMDRAVALLKGTTLSVEDVAYMLGYSNSSNLHKAFREYFHCSPREYVRG